MASSEAGLIINRLLVGESFERINFRYGLEASDVQFKFINIFCFLSIFLVKFLGKFALYLTFNLKLL